ncbi:MAG: hypothetical protein NTW08_10205 [Gammaproteobacteria bacterium]|nr:hypothetical protein [Gammaproteobacteria bacterium]
MLYGRHLDKPRHPERGEGSPPGSRRSLAALGMTLCVGMKV